MEHLNRIHFKAPKRPPVIECDSTVRAWYVRFRQTKVAKTVSEDKPGYIAAIDLDADNEVVGIELIGVKEFSISWLRRAAPVDVSKIDFERATFVPATAARDVVAA
jgi:hypothetical protein